MAIREAAVATAASRLSFQVYENRCLSAASNLGSSVLLCNLTANPRTLDSNDRFALVALSGNKHWPQHNQRHNQHFC